MTPLLGNMRGRFQLSDATLTRMREIQSVCIQHVKDSQPKSLYIIASNDYNLGARCLREPANDSIMIVRYGGLIHNSCSIEYQSIQHRNCLWHAAFGSLCWRGSDAKLRCK